MSTIAARGRVQAPLIDRIYECPFTPELWPGVLEELASLADAQGGYLVVAGKNDLKWTASAGIQGSMERLVDGNWLFRSERLPRALSANHAGFLTEHDVFTDEELAVDPFYRDFLWPAGFGWGVATFMPLPTGNTVIVGAERLRARGPVEHEVIYQLDALRPHLARSGLLSARLQLERAREAAETLARLNLPALVLDEDARVLAANALIEAQRGIVHWRAMDRVALRDRQADALLRRAIGECARDDTATRSFPIRADGDAAGTMIAHLLPIRGSARDLFVRCAAMLVLTPLTQPNAPPAELIQSLFDLSAAEARVARHLVAGSTVDEIASVNGVSSNTVRTQVRGVLEKTGCRRQTEIVALLSGVALAR